MLPTAKRTNNSSQPRFPCHRKTNILDRIPLSKNILSVTNRTPHSDKHPYTTTSISPLDKSMRLFSDKEKKYYKINQNEDFQAGGAHLRHMIQDTVSLSQQVNEAEDASLFKLCFKSSIKRVALLGLGAGLGYIMYRQMHFSRQTTELSSPLIMSQPFSMTGTLSPFELSSSYPTTSTTAKHDNYRELCSQSENEMFSTPLTTQYNSATLSYPEDPLMMEEWKAWARNVPPNTEELRDFALERLTLCLQSQSKTLDLSGLSLTELPVHLAA